MNETEPSLTSLKVYPDHNTVFQNTVPVVLEEILIYVSKHVLKTTAPHTDRQTKNKHKTNIPSKIQIRFCDNSTKGTFLTARFEVLMTIQFFEMLHHVD
jgi:hypothetical protein